MKEFLQACSFLPLPIEGDLIPIFPAGTVRGFDGRGPWRIENIQEVIAASKRDLVDLVIDRDHETDLMPPGTRIKAAGWIKELVEKDGALYARAEWTPAATDELKNKEYRYISPVFKHTKDGVVTRILRASLTNNPALEMKSVASARSEPSNQEETMDKMLIAIAAALGLSNPENPDAILAKAQEVANTLKTTGLTLASIGKVVGAEENASADVVLAAVQKTRQPDPKEFVPMNMFQETATALASLQKSLASERAEAAVSEAMKAGKISPAQKEWATNYASAQPDEFKKFVESAPVIVAAGESKTAGRPDGGNGQLDEAGMAICQQLGITPDSLKETLKAQNA